MDSCPEVAVYAGKRLAALVDSGAAVSLIHLQAYKLMPDTLKTAITLPGKLETLTTANGSPMHIIGHATITLHLKNLRLTHHFIVVESLMTDVILGIDFRESTRSLMIGMKKNGVTLDTMDNFSVIQKIWSQE